MKVCDCIACDTFPCQDVKKNVYVVPAFEIQPEAIKLIMISEVPPEDTSDYFYAAGNPFHLETTRQAFQDAGFAVSSAQDILNLGVYVTTAVKCGKTQYGIAIDTIKNCSLLLEKELDLFPNLQVIMLMGDVAIKSMNYIAKRQGEPRVIPAGSTYKIRDGEFFYQGKRAFPSYVQTGHNFLIEKSKRCMIGEDIKKAMGLLAGRG